LRVDIHESQFPTDEARHSPPPAETCTINLTPKSDAMLTSSRIARGRFLGCVGAVDAILRFPSMSDLSDYNIAVCRGKLDFIPLSDLEHFCYFWGDRQSKRSPYLDEGPFQRYRHWITVDVAIRYIYICIDIEDIAVM